MDHPRPLVEPAPFPGLAPAQAPEPAGSALPPGQAPSEHALDRAFAVSPGGLLHRRPASPWLVLVQRDPSRFIVATAFHEFSGDLTRGIVLQALRRPDGTPGPTICHSGNLAEFRHGGRSLSLDVEDAIVGTAVLRLPGRVLLRHESRFALPRRLRFLGPRKGAAAVRIVHEYAILAESPVLHLTVTLTPEKGVRLRQARVTTALDDLSPEDRPGVRRVQIWTEAGPAGTLPLPDAGGAVVLHAGAARHMAFPEEGGEAAGSESLAYHLRLLDGGRLRGVQGTVRPGGRLHWAVLRYAAAMVTGAEPLVVREERLLTTAAARHDADTEATAAAAAAMLASIPRP
jgi:hypothetical protein